MTEHQVQKRRELMISLLCGIGKTTRNEQRTQTNSQIQTTEEWWPVGGGTPSRD